MNRRSSTFRNAIDSTFENDAHQKAAAAAERVLEEWRQAGQADLPGAIHAAPCLLNDRSIFLDLVQNEFRHRREEWRDCSPTQYCRRFPFLNDDLLSSVHRLIEVEQYLGDNPDLLRLSDEPQWPAEGEVFGEFYLTQELGRGAVARVFKCRQVSLGDREVVLKVTRVAKDEASALGKLQHPNIVPVHSTGMESVTGLSWICMPFLGRRTLQDAISQAYEIRKPEFATDLLKTAPTSLNRLRWPQHRDSYEVGVIRMFAELASGLAYVHQCGLLHGDIKPSNILLTDAGTAMLIDFNLSRDISGENNLVGGTLPYMAPEQLRAVVASYDGQACRITPATEAFSFGVVLYQTLRT